MSEEIKNKDEHKSDGASRASGHDALHGGNWKTPRKLRRKKHPDLLHRLNTKMLAVRIATVTTVLFLLTAALSVFLYVQMLQAEEQYHTERNEANQNNLLLNAEKNEALTKLSDLQAERAVLMNQMNDALEELEQVKNERDELLASDEMISQLNQMIADLQAQIDERDQQIEALMEELQPDSEVNLQPLLSKLQAVQTLLENGAPKRLVSVKKTDEYGTIYYEDELVDANVSVYVYDPKTGFSYIWEVGNTYETGELKHLMLALSILDCATQELASLPEGVEAGKLTYDLSKEYELKSADIVSGSGILKNATPGTKYTYLELIEIMLSYCDVTAYDQLLKQFGNAADLFLPKVEGLSTTSLNAPMTARDMMLVLRKAKEMASGDSPYAKNLSDALVSAVSTYYSQAVGGTVARQNTLHAGGYHELGIRMQEDQGYMVVLMTDLNTMSPEFTGFLLSLYRALNELMIAFGG